MTSVNTNAAALTALRTLQNTNNQLESIQSRISTGLKIGEAKDNAAYWSISTTLKSDNKSLATVKDALGLGAATVDVAYQGLNKAKDVLDEIKSKLTSATQAGVDRKAVQADIDALQDQLKSIASSSTFSGENWLSVNSAVTGFSADKTVVASFSRDANNAVSIGTIKVDTSAIALFDSKAGSSLGIANAQTTLSANGVELAFGGNAATGAAPALQGLDASVAKAGQDVGALAAAKVTLGTYSAAGLDKGDTLSFDLALNGSSVKTIKVALSGTNATSDTNLANAIAAAINDASAFGSGAVTVGSTGGVIAITSGASGSASSVSVNNLKVLDGNTTLTSVAGWTDATVNGVAKFGDGSTNKVAVSFNSTGTAGANTIDNNDVLKFRFTYNGDLYETASRTLQAADVDMSDEFATVVKSMMEAATRVSDGQVLGAGKVTVAGPATAATTGTVNIETVGVGPSQSVSITSVYVNGASATGTAANGLVTASGAYGTANAIASTVDIAIPAGALVDGDTVSFDITLYADNATATGSVATKKTVSFATSSTESAYEANVQAALDKAFGVGKLKVNASTANNLKIETVATGPNAGLLIANTVAVEGDGTKSSALGLSSVPVSGTGRDLITTATKASATSAAAFAGPVTFDAGDSTSFDLVVNGTASTVKINQATINSALGVTTGTITTADDYAKVVNKALANANVSTVTASNASGVLKFEANTAGNATLSVSNVKSSSGSNTISVDEIDVNSASFNALTSTQKLDALNAYITVVNTAINKVTSAAASLGSISSRIDMQKNFVNTLMDTIEKGVGNLVDADMSEESTKLQALQVKQQLGVQSLSIANQSAQSVLSLFRG